MREGGHWQHDGSEVMASITGGKAVVSALEAEGVSEVFGLIGSAGMEIFDALHDSKAVRLIGVRDERTGVHMADGYARASGRAGVFLAGQNGPGATNLVTGLAQAYAAYSPVVALAGSLSSAHVHRDAFQEVDQSALFRPITKKTWTVTQAKRLHEMVREAFTVALSPRRGPVVLNLPRDMLADMVEPEDASALVASRAAVRSAGDPDAIRAAAKLLATAQRPLIIAGGGVKNGRTHAEALALAELLQAPVALSPGHGDAIPADHPLYAGQVGPRGNAVASALAREADVILALGTRLGFNTTFYTYDNLNRAAKIIHVDQEPTAVGRFFPVAAGIAGDAGRQSDQVGEKGNARGAPCGRAGRLQLHAEGEEGHNPGTEGKEFPHVPGVGQDVGHGRPGLPYGLEVQVERAPPLFLKAPGWDVPYDYGQCARCAHG
jgi:acetolactate synthase-1/2/3 large subunit/sulfoacetaldehyde acetyltransferase